MTIKALFTGDVNLMNVGDPAVPFRRVAAEMRSADLVFSNLECCLYVPPGGESVDAERKNEGFFADPQVGGEALQLAGIQAVGIANNVNYGADAILASIARLDALGIPHTGAGPNGAAARAPIVLERGGLRIGILQRTCVYWPTNHEATAATPGVAAIKGHTAYQVPFHKLRPDIPVGNRPGVPPLILTWVDPAYLRSFREDVAALRQRADFVVASCHWGYKEEVLDYMSEMAHAAIDAGADLVVGHGPHYSLAVEMYKGKPVYYGLGSFSFHTGHGGKQHGDWVGMLARLRLDGPTLERATFQFVRHNDANETVVCELAREQETLDAIRARSVPFKVRLTPIGDEVAIEPA